MTPGIPDLLWSAITVGYRPPLALHDALGREVEPVTVVAIERDGVVVAGRFGRVLVERYDRARGLAVRGG